MNIYKLYCKVGEDLDMFRGAIVAAESEEQARAMHPDGESVVTDDEDPIGLWVPLRDAHVAYIGKAKRGTKSGVILAS